MDPEVATIWVKVGGGKNNSLVIGGLYREHQQLGRQQLDATWLEKQKAQEDRLKIIVEKWKLAGANSRCILIGDINLDYGRWYNPEQFNMNMVDLIQNEIESSGFVQLIASITRRWRHQADSILDQVWSNCNHRIIRHFNYSRGDSDHNVVGVVVSTRDIKVGGYNVTKRTWKNFKKERFIEKFKNENWTEILNENNVDVANTLLEEKIVKILESEAPMKTTQMRVKYNNWITNETKMEMENRDAARILAKETDKDEDWASFREKRNLCTKLQRHDRTNYYKELFEKMEDENDAKQLFRTTKKLLGNTTVSPPDRFLVNGKVITKQKDLAEALATYYDDKVKKIKNTLPRVCIDPLKTLRRAFSRWTPPGGRPKFQLKLTTDKEVIEMLAAIKNSHAFGRDTIDGATMKIVAPIIAPIFRHIINLSLGSKQFPQKWKISRILPLQKSTDSDRLKTSSFRPVSQLPLLSKLTERVVQKQLLSYLEVSGQLATNQHAYRDKSSTITALLQLMDNIATSTDMNMITASMGIDQTAAFDCVDHRILIDKIGFYGLDINTVLWIESYLSSRSSYVVVGSTQSRMITMNHGVPQGSVLGPLMYLMYINEFPAILEDDFCINQAHRDSIRLFGNECNDCGSLTVFADDSVFLHASNNRHLNQEKVTNAFQKIKDYLNSNGLQINKTKTFLTEYMTKQKRGRIRGSPPNLEVRELVTDENDKEKLIEREKTINDSKYCRTLGMNLQNNLAWECHLISVKKASLPAARKQLGRLSRLADSLSFKVRLQLANSLVLSKICYGICIWGHTTHNYLRKAQILLNQTSRFVTGLDRSTRKSILMKRCNWLDIAQLTEYYTLIQAFKTVKWGIPESFNNRIQVDEDGILTTRNPRLLLTSSSYKYKAV